MNNPLTSVLTHRVGALLLLGIVSSSASSDIHDPQNSYLLRDLPTDAPPLEIEKKYFKKVVVDSGYKSSVSEIGSLTMGEWKTHNKFYDSGASVLSAKYFNSADLGLGRDMNCIDQSMYFGTGAMACYVSNHGFIGGNADDGFKGLEDENDVEFATVAMEYRPQASNNKVRFFVFGSNSVPSAQTSSEEDGKLVYLAGPADANGQPTASLIQLDNGEEGHSQPGLCLSCHGGSIDSSGNITNAHFLPFDTHSFEFDTFEDRKAREATFYAMNELVLSAETAMYGSEPDGSANRQIMSYLTDSMIGGQLTDSYVEPSFDDDSKNEEIYNGVVKHYCRGCHLASSFILAPGFDYDYGCSDFAEDRDMPHAEVNQRNLLRHMQFNKHVIEANSGSSCNQPVLLDFDNLDEITLARWNQSGSIATFSDGSRRLKVVEIDDPSIVGVAKKKRVLTLNENNYTAVNIGAVFFDTSAFNQSNFGSVDKLKFAYRLQQGAEIRIYAYGFKNGQFSGSSAIITASANELSKGYQIFDSSSTSLNSNLDLITSYSIYLDRENGSQVIEIDDVTFVHTPNSFSSSVFADFEDGTTGKLNITNSAISNQNSTCNTERQKIGFTKGFEVTNYLKFPYDGGRYSLTNNPVLCGGERIEQTITLNNTNKDNADVFIEFDYVSEIYATPYITIREKGSSTPMYDGTLAGLADQYGARTSIAGKPSSFGYIRLQLATGKLDSAEITFSLVASNIGGAKIENGGTSSSRVKYYAQGFAIDNLKVEYK